MYYGCLCKNWLSNKVNQGLAFDPLPFACSIKPRSEAKAKAIKQRFAGATATLSKYETVLTDEEKQMLAEERDSL
jgi:hypothetical protein